MSAADLEKVFAQRSLVVLLVIALAAQPASSYIAKNVLGHIDQGTDTWSLWSTYASNPAPDVLFVGDSRVRQDVDTSAIARALSLDSGQPTSVAKIGISNADAAMLDTVVYRVMAASVRPRTVVIAVSEFAFNENYQPDRTADYWQLSSPFDLGFMELALRRDRAHEARLSAGWAVPLVANAPIVAEGVQCWLRPDPTCTPAAHLEVSRMSPEERSLVLSYYADLYLRDFVFSAVELADIESAARRVQSGGSHLALVILPVNGIVELDPHLYAEYLVRIQAMAASMRAPLVDMHASVPEADWSLWVDPSHLNRAGAAHIANALAQVAASAS